MGRPIGSAWKAWTGLGAVAGAFWILRMLGAQHASGFSYAWLDLYGYVIPAARFIHDELLAGRLALWNPFQFAGLPTAAMAMPGALYPGNLLLLAALPAERALAVSTVLHWTAAGGFTWLFARRIGLETAPAAIAALTFMLSARILSGVYQHFILTTQVWLPALCWAVHGVLSDGRPRWIAALAGTLALAFLGGFLQTFTYEVQLAALYGGFGLVWICTPGTRSRAFAHAALAGLMALGLVAPLLLPALEFAGLANRSLDGITLSEASRTSVESGQLLRGLLGALGGSAPGLQPYPWLVALPALALPLALCAPLARRTRAHAAFFGSMALLAGLFTLGAATPVFRTYYALPLGNLFRLADRMDFIYVFCAGIVLACGTQGLIDILRLRTGPRAVGAISALLVLAVGGELFARSRLDIAHPVVLPPSERHVSLERAEDLRRSGDRVFLAVLPKLGTSERIFAVPDYEPSLPRAYADYFATGHPLWHGQLDLVKRPELLPLLDRMSVRLYGRAGTPRGESLRRAAGGRPSSPPFAAERPQATPRVFVATRVRVEPDPEQARRALLAGGPRDVVLDRDISGFAAQPGGTARLVRHDPQRVEIETDCAVPCLVVLTDLDYPGWQAELDGRPLEIQRANLIFRGVVAPAGQHRIVFEYRPAPFRIGVLASATTLATVAAFWGLTRRRARGTRTPRSPGHTPGPGGVAKW